MKFWLSATVPLALTIVGISATLALTANNNLPTNHLVPGWKNPEVKQATVDSTVCSHTSPSYNRKIRPPLGYTHYLKIAELRYEKLSGLISDYELDHFIPLSLGGSAYDTRNLWMETRKDADASDPYEFELWKELCAHTITLKEAQTKIISFKRKNG